MPRGNNSDPLRAYRFHAKIVRAPGGAGYPDGLSSPGIQGQAGFTAITGGQVTTDTSTYREGTMLWTKKYPGLPTTTAITLSRGIAIREFDFWQWVLAMIEGRECYADLEVAMAPRDAWRKAATSPQSNAGDPSDLDSGAPIVWEQARIVTYHNSFPTSYKIPDMDANTSDVVIQEMEVEYEYFDFKDPDAG